MAMLLKFIGVVFCVAAVHAVSLPPYITQCSRSLPNDQLSACITTQARLAQRKFAKGDPELDFESIDPLTLNDFSTKAACFNLNCTNVVVKGLRKVEIREMKWDLPRMQGHTRIFGNLTFLSDYEADGRAFLFPVSGNGYLLCKMYNTDITIKWKIRINKDENGVEHLEYYDYSCSQTYGNVKFHLTNLLGVEELDSISLGVRVNQILNENWRELMAQVGPPLVNAVADKVHYVINKMYSNIPYDELLAP